MCSGGIHALGSLPSASSSRSHSASWRSVFARRLRPRSARVSTVSARCATAPVRSSARATNSQPEHASIATCTSRPGNPATHSSTAAGVEPIRPVESVGKGLISETAPCRSTRRSAASSRDARVRIGRCIHRRAWDPRTAGYGPGGSGYPMLPPLMAPKSFVLRRRCGHDVRTAALEPREPEGEANERALDASSVARRS